MEASTWQTARPSARISATVGLLIAHSNRELRSAEVSRAQSNPVHVGKKWCKWCGPDLVLFCLSAGDTCTSDSSSAGPLDQAILPVQTSSSGAVPPSRSNSGAISFQVARNADGSSVQISGTLPRCPPGDSRHPSHGGVDRPASRCGGSTGPGDRRQAHSDGAGVPQRVAHASATHLSVIMRLCACRPRTSAHGDPQGPPTPRHGGMDA